MGGRRLQYLSRMGIDVFRRRDRAGVPQVAEPVAVAEGQDAPGPRDQMPQQPSVATPEPVIPDAAAHAAASSPGPAHAGSQATGPFEAYWVVYEACVVAARAPAHLIEDVVRAFAGQAQRPPASEPLQDAADLARRLTTHDGPALVFGEDLAEALLGEFVPHDIGALGSSRFVCALSPNAYADNPSAKRHLWRAMCRLGATQAEPQDAR